MSTLLVLIVACVDETSSDALQPELPCTRREPAALGAEAAVWVRADLGETHTRYCNAVTISPSLVVTTYSCVAHPAEIDFAALRLPGSGSVFPGTRSVYYEAGLHTELCGDDGRTREDGSFRARLAGTVPADRIFVGMPGSSEATATVGAVIAATSSSRCNDGPAVLLLTAALPARGVPLRLDARDYAGEQVLLSGATFQATGFLRSALESEVTQVTLGTGEQGNPARSLLLTSPACALDSGAAVLSVDTGALIGVISRGASPDCAGATAVATRLSAFRRLLLDAAATFSEELSSEPSMTANANAEPCAASVARERAYTYGDLSK